MIKSVDKGIFAVSFGGGQVDITSGKFVFNCTEAYEISPLMYLLRLTANSAALFPIFLGLNKSL